MEFNCFVPFLFVCLAYSDIGCTSAQSVSGECVDETLVLGAACKAKPHHSNFFELLENLIKKDTALIVLKLTISDADPNVRKRYRFDLVKTDLGQILLTLKSQMEFLSINLPFLSDKVDRYLVKLIPSPPGCLTNITIADALVKNWLLCGLTKEKDGIEKLFVKKVCFAKTYEEPGDWFLFRDTYYHECTDTSIKDSNWIRLNENPYVIVCKGILNYGVTVITILCVIFLYVYRRLGQRKTHLFLFELQKTQIINDEFQHSPPDNTNSRCCGCQQTVSYTDVPSSEQPNITGIWLDIGGSALISQNSFGLVSFLQAAVEEISDKVCEWCDCCSRGLNSVVLCIIIIVGVLVPVFLFYKDDPFHTLLDGIVGLSFLIISLSIVLTKALPDFCRHKLVYSARVIILEVTFFFFAFFVVTILVRVIGIIFVGFAFNSRSNIDTALSITVFFVLLNGYIELKQTHKIYYTFLRLCMKHIKVLVNEKNNTLQEPVFKNRIISSDPGDVTWPKKYDRKLELKKFVLFYLQNGESAINRDFFLDLCRNDKSHSPGDLKLNFCKGILKFMAYVFAVSVLSLVRYMFAKNFDSSLYSQAPSILMGGLLPIFVRYVLFPDYPKEENANFIRLLNNEAAPKKYNVAGYEHSVDEDQKPGVCQSICIGKREKLYALCCCCCKKKEELSNKQGTGINRDETTHGREAEERSASFETDGDTLVNIS